MKKSILIAASVLLLASCSSDAIVEETGGFNGKQDAPISFVTSQKNITRATTPLQNAGHYNFGVFAYKSTDAVNNIMDNYLVGYNGTNVGYYMTTANQTTLGDPTGEYNGKSQWAYEMLGSAEYDYTGPDGYYTKDQTAYMSNNANQYLKYWDKSAASTTFYAYAPYINSTAVTTGTASFDNSAKKLSIPNGTIVAAMVNGDATPEACEYMYATTTVNSADYGKDVELRFKRVMAKINIKFWEDLQGYSVKILDLTTTTDGVTYGVSAAPAIAGNPNTQGQYIKSSGFDLVFPADGTDPSITWSTSATPTSEALNFKSPTENPIGTTRLEASPSESSYYAIPKDATTGFTFHVSYEMTSDTGERIVVQNATVFVPGANCNWKANTHYTYNFKITTGSNGTTGYPGTINPNDPKVDTEEALYPIVFDNCTVEDWTEAEYDSPVTGGTDTRDYSVVLSSSDFVTGTKNIKAATGGTVTVKLHEDNDDITGSNTFTLTSPTGATGVTLSGSTVTVATGATTGLYTISWTNTNTNKSPAKTYSASFYVIGNYTVTTSTKYIGTNGNAATTLDITTKENSVAEAMTDLDGTFTIKYPTTCPADKKNSVTIEYVYSTTAPTTLEKVKVKVLPNAFAGTYSVVYTTDEGDALANFDVVDYSFNLSTNSVGLSTGDESVTITGAAVLPTSGTTSATSVYTIAGPDATNVTIDATTGAVTVKPAATTGKYTVTRTVTIDGSKTVYTQEFEVKDVYTLSLSKTVVDNDDQDLDTDGITKLGYVSIDVTSTKNGVASTFSIVEDLTNLPTGCLTIAGTKIKITSTCPAGTYTVKNGDVTKTFEVKD